MKPSLLTLIPARGGSKGVPRKNVRLFHGEPLIARTVKMALASGLPMRVVVSTDDAEIAEAARAAGAEVPFLRAPELAQDTTPMSAVALDMLSALGDQTATLMLLQPTSPLRSKEDLWEAHRLLEEPWNAVVSVTPVKSHPEWLLELGEDGGVKPRAEPIAKRRQDLPPVYALNGAIYLVRTAAFLQTQSFRPEKSRGYVMPPERSVDIDTELDWRLAEWLAGQTC